MLVGLRVGLFWALLDKILNAVLFVLIGMEVVVIAFAHDLLLAAAATVLRSATLPGAWSARKIDFAGVGADS